MLRTNNGVDARTTVSARGSFVAVSRITTFWSTIDTDGDDPNMLWTHETVYSALVDRENGECVLQSERYVVLYPQKPYSAILYAPGGRYDSAPLHLNEMREGFRADVFERMSQSIEFVRRDNKGPGKEVQNWNHYRIPDWRRFADALNL